MKIGILTLPLHTNYGGILQAYALQTVLERMGHEVKMIDLPYQRKLPRLSILLRRFVKNMLNGFKGYVFFEKHYNRWLPIMRQQTDMFVSKYISMTDKICNFSELQKEQFDIIIVGSDQIWRPAMFLGDPATTYLDFAKDWDIKRIAYAASFGTDVWELDVAKTKECCKLASLFSAISVREESGRHLCKKYLKKTPEVVLDPTLLLDEKDFVSLIEQNKTPKSNGDLFNYILDIDVNKQAIIDFIAEERDLIPFRVNSNDSNIRCDLSERVAMPVESWLRGFYDAKFIVTDSFHACVFSIIFKKQFVVVGNKKRGMARFETLLGNLGLMDRMINDVKGVKCLNSAIDYTHVYERLNKLKKHSMKFLYNAII